MARTHSLEQRLMRYAAFIMLIVLTLCIGLVITWRFDWFASISIILPIVAVSLFAIIKSYKLTLDVIERFGSQLDALANNESNSWHLAQYQNGRVANLKNDFTKLSDKIAQSKRHYMQTEEFVFEFASMLDLPIVILDPHGQVYFSNKAFLNTLTAPNVEGLNSADLGLIYNDSRWQIEKESRFKRRFIVSAQTFWRTGRNYELLTLFSIEQQLRANEQDIWQRLIRVLNHEVRNSLTPIYSMSQSLQTMKQQGQITSGPDLAQDMLQVIEKRAQHLLDFVNSYSAFSKLPTPNKQQINNEQVNLRLQAIFPELVIHSSQPVNFKADLGQLEQALINLIKNAFEAGGNTPPTLNWQQQNDNVVIELTDSGTGIANPDNLFVPFYSTKPDGAGIGLVMSRELIRNLEGDLTLLPNVDIPGSKVTIKLPYSFTQ